MAHNMVRTNRGSLPVMKLVLVVAAICAVFAVVSTLMALNTDVAVTEVRKPVPLSLERQ